MTLAISVLGRVTGEKLGEDSAASAAVSLSLGEQDGHPALISGAGNAVVLSSEAPLGAGRTVLNLCGRRAGVLCGLMIRPLLQTLRHLPKRLASGPFIVLFLGTCNGEGTSVCGPAGSLVVRGL